MTGIQRRIKLDEFRTRRSKADHQALFDRKILVLVSAKRLESQAGCSLPRTRTASQARPTDSREVRGSDGSFGKWIAPVA